MSARQTASAKAAQLSAKMASVEIVGAFEITDKLLEEGGLSTADYLAVCDARGWMIDELARRDELFLIGLGDAPWPI